MHENNNHHNTMPTCPTTTQRQRCRHRHRRGSNTTNIAARQLTAIAAICTIFMSVTADTYVTDYEAIHARQPIIGPMKNALELCEPRYMLRTIPAFDMSTRRVASRCDCRYEPNTNQKLVTIDCGGKTLSDSFFDAVLNRTVQPLIPRTHYESYRVNLLLSGNLLHEVPADLQRPPPRRYDLSHNFIERLYDQSFDAGRGGEYLEELVLSWNQIDKISAGVFAPLKRLRLLDLSNNHLVRLPGNVMSPLVSLRWLDVSRNRGLDGTMSAPEFRLFLEWGVTTKLEVLRAEECGIRGQLRLAGEGVGLRELWLKYNRMERLPDVPRGLRVLDVSGNPVRRLVAKGLPVLTELEVLYVRDMPELVAVEEWSLEGLPALKNLSFSGSFRLAEVAALAFGWAENATVASNDSLAVLDLSGTALRGVNVSTTGLERQTRLAQLVERVETLDLMGAPVECDCDLLWLVQQSVELRGECDGPAERRGRRLETMSEHELGCDRWTRGWTGRLLNGLAILALLVVCVVATWCLVTHIRPQSRRDRLQKVGDTSPYARVTIESNQQL